MKIFKDPALLEEVDILDLGIVPAGTTKEYVFYVQNDEPALLVDLEFKIDHKEVKIITYPKQLEPLEVGELRLTWTPSVTVKQGLRTSLQVTGKELWS